MNKLFRHTTTFSFLTLVSRLTGLLRVMAFAAILGNGRFDDAYQLANTLPNILYEFIVGGLLSAVLIPLLVREQQRHGKTSAEAWRTANLLLGYVGVTLGLVSALAVAFAPQIVGLLTALGKSTHAASSRELAVYFFRFFAPQMFFYGLNAVFMAILNSHNIFGITAAAPILNNVVMLLTLGMYSAGVIGVTGLALGTTAGIAAMALVQLPWLLRLRMPFAPRFSFRDPLLGSILALGLPVIAVAGANLIATAVRANLLYTVAGGYTTYTFCFQLVMMPYGIIAVSIATVLYPTLSEHAAGEDRSAFLDAIALGIRWTLLALLPVSLGISVLAEPITRVLFERGQFHYADTLFTSRFLAIYALSIVPYALVVFATRIFYAMKDTLTPAWINIVGVLLNILLNFTFVRAVGVAGIAMSSTLTYLFTLGASLAALHRRLKWREVRQLVGPCMRMVLAASAMAIIVLPLLALTRPGVAVLEQGTEFPAHISAAYDAGGVLVLRDSQSFDAFWALLRREDSPLPPVDFGHERVVAVFAPRGSHRARLRISEMQQMNHGKGMELLVDVYRSPRSNSPQTPSQRAYLIARVRGSFENVSVRFVIKDELASTHWMHLLQLPELFRLVFIIAVGGTGYLLACKALGVSEIESLFRTIRERLVSTRRSGCR